MDVVYLHERRDEILVILQFDVSDFSIRWCDDSLGDGSFRVTEEYKEKNKDTKNRDKSHEEPKG
jgi:hypothetical protein